MKFVAKIHLVIASFLCIGWDMSYWIPRLGCLEYDQYVFGVVSTKGLLTLATRSDKNGNSNQWNWRSFGTEDTQAWMETFLLTQKKWDLIGLSYTYELERPDELEAPAVIQREYYHFLTIPYWMLVSFFSIFPAFHFYRSQRRKAKE